jgi:outer membrane protein OmpA-like peptidoglycan-associated protein
LAFVALIAVAGYFGYTQGCSRNMPGSPTANIPSAPPAGPSGQEVGEPVIPQAVAPAFREGSTEQKMYTFLADAGAKVDAEKGTWFDFDQVNFVTGSEQLTPESEAQLETLVSVLGKFPAAKFKIGGYTDNTGKEEVNVKISGARAAVVLEKLKTLGMNADQLTGSEGYGSQHPIADNKTEEGRAQNRRISVRVVAK